MFSKRESYQGSNESQPLSSVDQARSIILAKMRSNQIRVGDPYYVPLDMLVDVQMEMPGEQTYSAGSTIDVCYYKGESVFHVRDGNTRYWQALNNGELQIWATVKGVYKR